MHHFNIESTNRTKKTFSIFFGLFIVHVIGTFIPITTTPVIGLPMSLNLMFFIEFVFSLGVFFYFFVKIESFSVEKIKTASVALFMLVLIQFAIYSLRANDIGSISLTKDNALSIIIVVLIVPFYEEVFYRGCLLGFLNSLNSHCLIPIITTSVIFSLMHTQYTSLSDHLILVFIAIILCTVRIMTRSLLLPYLLHMSMNLFVILLNVQGFY